MTNAFSDSLIDLETIIDREEDVAALARMIRFAQNSAEDLRLESTVYCLKMAMQALYQQVTTETAEPLAANEKFEPAPRH